MKICIKCLKSKNFEEFGKDKHKNDDLNSYCKECIKERNRITKQNYPEKIKKWAKDQRERNKEKIKEWHKNYYAENREMILEKERASYHRRKKEIAKRRAQLRRTYEAREKQKIRMAEWRGKYKNEVSARVTKWKKDNPEKHAAHALILWSIKSGIIKRSEKCEECGILCKTEGHHRDYKKPMKVIWLCKLCHSKKHRIYR